MAERLNQPPIPASAPKREPVVCRECGCSQDKPRDPFCKECDADLRPFLYDEIRAALEQPAARRQATGRIAGGSDERKGDGIMTNWADSEHRWRRDCVDKALYEALKAVVEDFGVTQCYCGQLTKGKCGYCMGTAALSEYRAFMGLREPVGNAAAEGGERQKQ